MEILIFLFIGIVLLIPLALVVGGIALIVNAAQSIQNSLKGKNE